MPLLHGTRGVGLDAGTYYRRVGTLLVPATVDDLSLQWFNEAIREGGVLDAEFDSLTVEPMDPSKGLIGDLATLSVTYERGSGPSTFVIKLPAANPDSRRIGEMLGAYAREVAFYRAAAPHSTSTRLPKCFYTGADDSQQHWAIILEYIDADPFDYFAGATDAQAATAVDALADFHAVWWESHIRFDWMPGFDRAGVGGLQPMWLANLPVFIERYGHVLPGATSEWVLRFAPSLTNWCQGAAHEPLTMVHSDYRIDNLLFTGDHVTMIDWQTAMRAPAAMDLSCFITTSLSIERRRQTERQLIDRYLARLNSQGVSIDTDWFNRSYDENILWWMGQFGNNLAHLDPGNEIVQQGLTAMIERVYTAAADRNVGRLLAD